MNAKTTLVQTFPEAGLTLLVLNLLKAVGNESSRVIYLLG